MGEARTDALDSRVAEDPVCFDAPDHSQGVVQAHPAQAASQRLAESIGREVAKEGQDAIQWLA